jgi:hypothetical protein
MLVKISLICKFYFNIAGALFVIVFSCEELWGKLCVESLYDATNNDE